MCGVIGFLGDDAIANTLDGLESLEYRGYDSVGISFQNGRNFLVSKSLGDTQSLRKKVKSSLDNVKCAIGHTRWATHGAVSEANAHPHLSTCGKVSVVHNGIIENYREITEFLTKRERIMKTPVDTEVIPNLIAQFLDGSLLEATRQATKILTGSYAFLVTSVDIPDTIIATRHGKQALTIGVGNDFYFVTSDIPTAMTKTNVLYSLENDEFAVIKKKSLVFFNGDGKEIIKKPLSLKIDSQEIDKAGFSTFMEKEINEIPSVIKRITTEYKKLCKTKKFKNILGLVKGCETLHIAACGTAYHAGLLVAQLLEAHYKIRVKVYIASELSFSNPHISEKDVGMVISQSGETADTLGALHLMKQWGLPTIGICNVDGSSISRQVDYFLPCFAGTEVAVASTKAYIAQVLVGTLLTQIYTWEDYNILANQAEKILELAPEIKLLAKKYKKIKKIFVLGKGLDFVGALESALKIKEITYRHCEGFAGGELKHGTLSLVDKDTLTITISTSPDNDENKSKKLKLENAVQEVIARGSKIWRVSIKDDNKLSFILGVMPLQFYALYLSQALKLNPDKPRHLAKSVTVE